jgi:hypothetical protein
MVIAFEPLVSPIGPAGDRLHLPLRITGGRVSGLGSDKNILGGDDFAIMYADEKLIHDGRFAVDDPAGDLLVRYYGTTLAGDGAYDDVLDGHFPASAACRLSVELISAAPGWRTFVRRPLLGVGFFNGQAGRLEMTILSVTAKDGRN